MTRIKICGITSMEDAFVAVDAGANALGFIFAKSPRQIIPKQAREIISSLPPFVQTVGVFVNERSSNIKKIMDLCGLDLIQLHGNESVDECMSLMPRAIKAFRIQDDSSLEQIRPYAGKVRAFVLDTYSKRAMGGTGKTFDWKLAVTAKQVGVPVILAGGLSPVNIGEAVSLVRPFAVDINSGVEDSPGRKNSLLVRQAVAAVRQADQNNL